MKKWLIIAAAVVLVAVLVGVNMKNQRSRATKVDVAPVETLELTEIVSASGQIQPKISVDISSDVTGKIVEVLVNEGARVRKGDLLLRIDPKQFREALNSTEAQYQSALARFHEAEARLEQADLEWTRVQVLHRNGDMSERNFEQSRVSHKVAETQRTTAERAVEQAEAGLEQMRDRFEKTEIRSPMTGVVIRRNAEVGEIAMEGTFSIQVLMVIADLSVMEVEVDVDETEIPQIAPEQKTNIEIDAFPDDKFEGRVTEIANSPEQMGGGTSGVDYKVVVTLDEGYMGLRPGLSATAKITTAHRDSALAIPIQSLTLRTKKTLEKDMEKNGERLETLGIETVEFKFEKDEKEAEGVFVTREGRAIFLPVITGIAGEKHFEVISGLGEDDIIVEGPMRTLRNLKHGEKVKVDKKKDRESDKEDEDEENGGGGPSVSIETD